MQPIKTSHGLAILGICFLLSLLFINWAGKQIDSIALYIPAGSQTAQVVSSLPDGLVAHYTFDDNTNDSAGSSNGTVSGGATYVDGKIGRAMQFDGVDDYVNTGNSTMLDSATLASWSFWIKEPTLTNSVFMLSKYDTNYLGASWGINKTSVAFGLGNDEIMFTFSASINAYTNSNIFTANKWYHVVFVYDGSQSTNATKLNLYVNGVSKSLAFGGTLPSSLASAARTVKIGAESYSSTARGYFKGSLDDVRIYNRALSASEVTDLYNMEVIIDTTAPSVPTGLTASNIQSTQATISWIASTDNTAVSGYKIFRNGTQIGTSNTTSFTDTGLTAETTYLYTVSAYDAAGNESNLTQVTVKTQDPRTTSGDIISNLQVAGRTIDWSRAGIPGGIPTGQTVCANVKTDYGAKGDGTTDDTAAFQSAVNACPNNQVVYIPAGDYNLAGRITARHPVVLRGAGPGKTILELNIYMNIVFSQYGGSYASPTYVVDWTAGYTQGTTQITLANTSSLHIGQEVVLDELNDPGFVNPRTCGIHANSCGRNGLSFEAGGLNSQRALQQIVRVTAINGNVVTIDTPLYITYKSNLSPQAFFWGSGVTAGNIRGAGIEDMSINDNQHQSPVYFSYCTDCWVQNVDSYNMARDAFLFFYSYRPVIRDSYFHDTLQYGAPTEYDIEFASVSDGLVENNIFTGKAASFVSSGPISGNIIAYNYAVNTDSGWLFGFLEPHSAHYDMNLFEGNVGPNIVLDYIWGSGSSNTLFRNRLYGSNNSGASNNLFAVTLQSWQRYNNIIGNVLGTSPTQQGSYELSRSTPKPTGSGYAIYNIGFQDAWFTGLTNYDDTTYDTLARWGNYDYLNSSTQWNPDEIPADVTVPSSQSLPASLYLSSKPSWWGSASWPAIGSDVSGLAQSIPTQSCYQSQNLANTDNFDADACYYGTPSITPSTCISFTYSLWGTCSNNKQTKTITSSSPVGCTGGTPEQLTQSCTTSTPADLNHDGKVNTDDLKFLTGDWNKTNSSYDLNKDGIVNSLDYVIMVQGWTG